MEPEESQDSAKYFQVPEEPQRSRDTTTSRITRSRDTCAALAADKKVWTENNQLTHNTTAASIPAGATARHNVNRHCPADKSSEPEEGCGEQTTNDTFPDINYGCYRYVEEKGKDGMSGREARLEWLQARVTARLVARQRAIDTGGKQSSRKGGKTLPKDDEESRMDLSLREMTGIRVPLPAWMPGQTAEARDRREMQVAEDFIAGKYDPPTSKEKSNKERRQACARRRVRKELGEKLRRDMFNIDWEIVIKRIDPTEYELTLDRIKEPPTATAILAARRLEETEEDEVHGFSMEYLLYVRRALDMIEKPDPLEDSTTTRNRTKLSYLGSVEAEITEDCEWAQMQLEDDTAGNAEEENMWKLQLLQERANPMARAVWKAEQQRDLAGRGRNNLVYVDGLPIDLRPVMPRLLPGRWETRRGAVCRWSPCLQCQIAGVGECSTARVMAQKPKHRPCLRCRREGLACIRGDDDLEHRSDKSLAEMGVARWETYEAADQESLSRAEAQAVAREMLDPRGKRFLNVCGVMVDAEDTRRFAPVAEAGPSMTAWQMEEEEGERKEAEEGKDGKDTASLMTTNMSSQEAVFAKRMTILRCDEYWQGKAEAAGRGVKVRSGAKMRRMIREIDEGQIPSQLWAI